MEFITHIDALTGCYTQCRKFLFENGSLQEITQEYLIQFHKFTQKMFKLFSNHAWNSLHIYITSNFLKRMKIWSQLFYEQPYLNTLSYFWTHRLWRLVLQIDPCQSFVCPEFFSKTGHRIFPKLGMKLKDNSALKLTKPDFSGKIWFIHKVR